MKIAELIDGIPSLGSYSGVIAEIETVLNCPDSNLADLGEVIEKDPDLTGRLLKLGNSAFFGFPNRLETVSEAISLIGIQQAKDLILVSSVVEIFDGISEDVVSMESFWKHCIACGVGARCLAIVRQMPKAEKFFVAGLLHDLGRLVLFSRIPKKAMEIFNLCRARKHRLWEAEREILGFDHAEIGGELMRSWHYPSNLANAVSYHHHPTLSSYQLESSIVHVADYLAHAMQMGNSGEQYVPPLELKAWERLGLATDMLESVMKSIDEQIEAVQEVFLNSGRKAASASL